MSRPSKREISRAERRQKSVRKDRRLTASQLRQRARAAGKPEPSPVMTREQRKAVEETGREVFAKIWRHKLEHFSPKVTNESTVSVRRLASQGPRRRHRRWGW